MIATAENNLTAEIENDFGAGIGADAERLITGASIGKTPPRPASAAGRSRSPELQARLDLLTGQNKNISTSERNRVKLEKANGQKTIAEIAPWSLDSDIRLGKFLAPERIVFTKAVLEKYYYSKLKYLLDQLQTAGPEKQDELLKEISAFKNAFHNGNLDEKMSTEDTAFIRTELKVSLEPYNDGLLDNYSFDPQEVLELAKIHDAWLDEGFERIKLISDIETRGLDGDNPGEMIKTGDKNTELLYHVWGKLASVNPELNFNPDLSRPIDFDKNEISGNANKKGSQEVDKSSQIENQEVNINQKAEIVEAHQQLAEACASFGYKDPRIEPFVSAFINSLGDQYILLRGETYRAVRHHQKDAVIKSLDFRPNTERLYYFSDQDQKESISEILLEENPDTMQNMVKLQNLYDQFKNGQIDERKYQSERLRLCSNIYTQWSAKINNICDQFGCQFDDKGLADNETASNGIISGINNQLTQKLIEFNRYSDEMIAESLAMIFKNDYTDAADLEETKRLIREALSAKRIKRETCIDIIMAVYSESYIRRLGGGINDFSDSLASKFNRQAVPLIEGLERFKESAWNDIKKGVAGMEAKKRLISSLWEKFRGAKKEKGADLADDNTNGQRHIQNIIDQIQEIEQRLSPIAENLGSDFSKVFDDTKGEASHLNQAEAEEEAALEKDFKDKRNNVVEWTRLHWKKALGVVIIAALATGVFIERDKIEKKLFGESPTNKPVAAAQADNTEQKSKSSYYQDQEINLDFDLHNQAVSNFFSKHNNHSRSQLIKELGLAQHQLILDWNDSPTDNLSQWKVQKKNALNQKLATVSGEDEKIILEAQKIILDQWSGIN